MKLRMITASTAIAFLAAAPLLGGASAASAADGPPGDVAISSECEGHWRYKTTGRGADSFSRVGGQKSAYNGTKSTARVKFTSSSSSTVGASLSTNVNVGLSVILASANQSLDLGVHSSLTVQKGVDIEIRVPSKHTGVGRFGAFRAYVKGTEWYENRACRTSKKHTVKAYAPYRDGWKTWIE